MCAITTTQKGVKNVAIFSVYCKSNMTRKKKCGCIWKGQNKYLNMHFPFSQQEIDRRGMFWSSCGSNVLHHLETRVGDATRLCHFLCWVLLWFSLGYLLDSLWLLSRPGGARPVADSFLSFPFLLDAGMISSGSLSSSFVLFCTFILFWFLIGSQYSSIFSQLFFPHMLQWAPIVQLAGLDLEAEGRCSQECPTHPQLHKQLFMGYFQLLHKHGALRRSFSLVCS